MFYFFPRELLATGKAGSVYIPSGLPAPRTFKSDPSGPNPLPADYLRGTASFCSLSPLVFFFFFLAHSSALIPKCLVAPDTRQWHTLAKNPCLLGTTGANLTKMSWTLSPLHSIFYSSAFLVLLEACWYQWIPGKILYPQYPASKELLGHTQWLVSPTQFSEH